MSRFTPRLPLVFALTTPLLFVAQASQAKPPELRGLVVDNDAAQLTGTWIQSTTVRPFVGKHYAHDNNENKGKASARYDFTIPSDGQYDVLVSYSSESNRDDNVPVEIHVSGETKTVYVDQSRPPKWQDGFEPLGRFRFSKDTGATVVISNRGTTEHVIADAIRLVPASEFELAKKEASQIKLAQAAAIPKKRKPSQAEKKKETPPPAPAPKFVRAATKHTVSQLTATDLDALLKENGGPNARVAIASDETFLRRATLDVVGRQPTRDELLVFLAQKSDSKRAAVVDRLLASDEYGKNWANYWSDAIGYRQQEPELTFHDYSPFKNWLAERFNAGAAWDEMVYDMLTARGKVGKSPAATFIGFHQGNGHRLAGETTRVFLSVKIHCVECHDHPFVDMPQEVFHGFAAFFARTEAKIAQLDSDAIEVRSKGKGEHRMSGKKGDMPPKHLGGSTFAPGMEDMARRAALANWVVGGDNPYFARSYVNRIWSRLVGRGFAEPVDNLGEDSVVLMPEAHRALADHLIASQFDHRSVFRLVMNTRAYQRALTANETKANKMFATATKPIRGDEVFQSLVTAIGLENITPPRAKKSGAVRFPPPPKSTRDRIDAAFGFDPSFPDKKILRTMKQAMLMMNDKQLAVAIDAAPESDSFLSKLLAKQPADGPAIESLFQHILARNPSEAETKLLLAHIEQIGNRQAAFEDMLWSLINSAEFTTRK